jgi:hypothetical protein
MNKMNMPGMDKFMNRMFRKAEGVVWDLMSGKIGVMTEEGISTLEGEGDDARVSVNLMDDFGVALPAFAQSTPVADVKVGDIIYSGKTRITWVIAVNTDKGNFRVMKPNGESTTWTPPKVSMLGFESGVMVLRSLMSMLPNGDKGLGQMQNMMLPMMMMSSMNDGDGDNDEIMDKMMPMILMSQMNGGDGGGMGGMMQNMMMMKMMMGNGGGDNPMSSMFGGSKKKPQPF